VLAESACGGGGAGVCGGGCSGPESGAVVVTELNKLRTGNKGAAAEGGAWEWNNDEE
jgi:hypothetical protein